MDEESGEDHALYLDDLFNSFHTLEDLLKGHFHLDPNELNEESAEVSTTEFLQHYHMVADHLE